MISKRIKGRKDGKSSASDSLRYGEGLKVDRETGKYLDKSHRTRFGGFGLIDDGVYTDLGIDAMEEIINLAAIEMQANCDLNTRVAQDKRIAHFVISFDQDKPTEAVLRDTEDSMLAAMGLDHNHFSTFLHNDNGYWHLHIFASRIEKNKSHRGNSLWNDQTIRDKVCREIEIRHGLKRDNGMHEITDDGKIVEIPLAERRAKRKEKHELNPEISDRAKTAEIYSGEKSFQTWANEMRIGDRLKHAKSWRDIHAAAAAYNCEIKAKGAGFVICPVGEKGGIQLSKVGLKNLPSKFGAFTPAPVEQAVHQAQPEAEYKPAPTQAKAGSHYAKWCVARDAFKPAKTIKINKQRDAHKEARAQLVVQQKSELAKVRAGSSGQERIAAVSIAKMQHSMELIALKDQFAQERQELRTQLAAAGPGNTLRDYLLIEAAKGDNVALGLARKYGVEDATDVLRIREADQLKIVAALEGKEYRPAQRLSFTHQVERSGTVVYDFGQGRRVIDSAIAKQVQLNDAAAHSPEAVAMSLQFAASKFGNTLTLTGTQEFQRLAVETAVKNRLGIKFADTALEAYRQKLVAEQQSRITHTGHHVAKISPDLSHLTHRQIAEGVEHVLRNTLDYRDFGHTRPPDHILRAEEHRQIALSNRAGGLHELPTGRLDDARQDVGMLLPDVVPGRLGNQKARQYPDVRRPGSTAGGSGSERFGNASSGIAPASETEIAGVVRPDDGQGAGETSKRSRLPVNDLAPSNQSAPPGRVVDPDVAVPHQAEIVSDAPQPTSVEQQEIYRAQLAVAETAKVEARTALIADLEKQGKKVTLADAAKKGISYPGKMEQITVQFMVQKQGGSAIVIHDLAQLEGNWTVGEFADIKYVNGRGQDQQRQPGHEKKGTSR